MYKDFVVATGWSFQDWYLNSEGFVLLKDLPHRKKQSVKLGLCMPTVLSLTEEGKVYKGKRERLS